MSRMLKPGAGVVALDSLHARRCLIVLVLMVGSHPAAAQAPLDGFAFAGDVAVAPGATMTIPGAFEDAVPYSILLYSSNSAGGTPLPPIRGIGAGNQVAFTLPTTLKPGPYHVVIDGMPPVPVAGGINVQVSGVKLESISPATSYKSKTDRFDFDLIGEGFSADVCSNDVTIAGQGSIIQRRTNSAAECAAGRAIECPGLAPRAAAAAPGDGACLWVEGDRLMHVVGYPGGGYQGPVSVSVRVGSITTPPQPLVLARMSATAVLILSGVAAILLFYGIAWVVGGGLANHAISGRRLNIAQSFLFDPETNSYSLSKFQFLMFSATFIFSYVYVLLSRLVIQWQFSLPDVPPTMAGILAISAGTSVTAAGLTAARGSKGAGLQHPTGADLVSSGGVVVPERFQLFVWTIVACGGFVALLIGQDPSRITDFPEIPQGLLYVMGVSATGYLGGKATRRPGPVLQNIAIVKDQPPVIIVSGRNLSDTARFFIDEHELPIVPESQRPPELRNKRLIETTPQADSPEFATQLKITVAAPDVNIVTGSHRFRIVNRDGQFADMAFSADDPRIRAVRLDPDPGTPIPADDITREIAAGTGSVAVRIAGENFHADSTLTWESCGGDPIAVPIEAGQGSDNDLRTRLVPGPAGMGVMTLLAPTGAVARAMVKVSSASAAPPASPLPATAATVPAAPVGSEAPAPGPAGEGEPGSAAPNPGADMADSSDGRGGDLT